MFFMGERPSIFEYSNYRAYLKDSYLKAKEAHRQFSFRVFSRMAGFKSPNFLKLVMEGQRNLSAESIQQIAQALKLGKEESAFFRNLVLLEQAETLEEKKYFAEQVARSRAYRRHRPLGKDQISYYSHWYNIAIRELADTEGFRAEPAWIASALTPRITESEAQQGLETLLKLGLLKTEQDGRIRQNESVLSTGNEIASVLVGEFHRQMILKGSEAIERFPSVERDISSLTLGLSKKGAQDVKELIQSFRKQLLEIAQNDQQPERVYQVNFQLFPLSKREEKS